MVHEGHLTTTWLTHQSDKAQEDLVRAQTEASTGGKMGVIKRAGEEALEVLHRNTLEVTEETLEASGKARKGFPHVMKSSWGMMGTRALERSLNRGRDDNPMEMTHTGEVAQMCVVGWGASKMSMVEMRTLTPKKRWAKVGEEEGDRVVDQQEEVMRVIGMVSGQTTTCMTVLPLPVESVRLLYRAWIWPHCLHANAHGMMAQALATWTLLVQDLMKEELVDQPQEMKVGTGLHNEAGEEVVGVVVGCLTLVAPVPIWVLISDEVLHGVL